MNELERAGWLARAIDNLIHRHPAEANSDDPSFHELDGILESAGARLDIARFAARVSIRHELSVWEKIVRRLEGYGPVLQPAPLAMLANNAHAEKRRLSGHELQELEEAAALRQHVAARMNSSARAHYQAVWQQVQHHLELDQLNRGLFGFLRRDRPHSQRGSSPLEELATQILPQSSDSHTDELIELVRKRRVLGVMTRQASSRAQRRVWSRLALRAQNHAAASRPRRLTMGLGWQQLAATVATLAIVFAALGPIPATGLAGHPFARFLETVGHHVGVSESGPPPVAGEATVVVEGTQVTAAEASDLLGITVSDPVPAPAGYHLTASLYYPVGLTGEGGTFMRSYISGDSALLLFQEAATDVPIGVSPGWARDITLADGTRATHVTGGWIPGPSGFSWTGASAQTLVFDRSGVRTVIQFMGDDTVVPDLAAMASELP